METRAGHQGRQALHELQRLHDDMGGAALNALFSWNTTLAARLRLSRSLAIARRVI